MHDLNSLVKSNVLLFKIQVKKRKNRRREDPVICGSGNLKATSRAEIIFMFDLNSFSNLKTVCSHAFTNGLLCMSELTPRLWAPDVLYWVLTVISFLFSFSSDFYRY